MPVAECYQAIYPVMLRDQINSGYSGIDTLKSAWAEYRPGAGCPTLRVFCERWERTAINLLARLGTCEVNHPCRKSPMFMRLVTMSRVKCRILTRLYASPGGCGKKKLFDN